MCRSPSIEELQAKDDKFRTYINKIQKELDDQASNYIANIEKQANDLYTKQSWDNVLMLSGQNTQFFHEKGWSLENVNNAIKAVSNALFGGSEKPPEGTDIESTVKTLAIEALEGMELYVASKAFSIITGVLDNLKASTSIEFQHQDKMEPVGPGMRLWVVVASQGYQTQSFFGGETITEYLFGYRCYWSEADAKAGIKQTELQAYANQAAAFKAKMDNLADQWVQGKITDEEYQEKNKVLSGICDALNARIADLSKQKSKEQKWLFMS